MCARVSLERETTGLHEDSQMGIRRKPNNRRASARKFNKDNKKTHLYNVMVMRGGWRL